LLSFALLCVACGDDPTPETTADAGTDVIDEATVDAGSDAEADAPDEVAAAEGPVFAYDPVAGEFAAFPDDYFTVADPATETGLRVHMVLEDLPGIEDIPRDYRGIFDDLSTLDGFGTTAGAILPFTGMLDPDTITSGVDTVLSDSTVFFGYLDDEGAFVPVAVEVNLTVEEDTLILRPMAPLPATRQALAGVTTSLLGAGGSPVQAGPVLRSILEDRADEAFDTLQPRIAEASAALQAAGWIQSSDDIGGLLVFTTQSIAAESLAIAADIQAREHEVAEYLGCTEGERFRQCTVSFDAGHYRDEDGHLLMEPDGGPPSRYRLLVEIYLPLEGEAPYPLVIFGHGLGSGRTQGRRLAEFAAPLGMATVGIDAPEHADHPVRQNQSDVLTIFDFFGLQAAGPLDALALRDNWRQSTYDKLALIELLLGGLDVDDDGDVDLDSGRMAYLGVSLGGIMGPELLALSPDLKAAVLVVAGGRVSDILQFGSMFAPLVELLTPAGVSPTEVQSFWPLLQTAIERGDSANYAVHVINNRLVDDEPTQVLLGIVLDDEIVPEAANFLLARALDIPHVPPVRRPIGLIPIADEAPLSGNLPGGGTAGLVQLDWILEDGLWETATHDNVGDSTIGAESWFRFLDAYLQDGVGLIVDPYVELGLERPQ
jgi:hypothetical protein